MSFKKSFKSSLKKRSSKTVAATSEASVLINSDDLDITKKKKHRIWKQKNEFITSSQAARTFATVET